MDKFKALLDVAEHLNGPNGCPWDRSQNFFSLQPYILEEAHEAVEAIDTQDDELIVQELGDLFYTVIFYCKLAQKEGRFTIWDLIDKVREKLIRRHPHVFGEVKAENIQEVLHHWERVKKSEKEHAQRASALDGIPEKLPLLAKAQKVISKIKRSKAPLLPEESKQASEQEIGEALLALIAQAEASKVDVEGALRRALAAKEKAFRTWESTLR